VNKVSVIIPTYNRAELLKESLLSVIAQTYRPIECIVVDDGSKDNTRAVIEDIIDLTDDSFILQYVLQSKCGAQTARNRGTAIASGKYIQYLDSDDILFPDKISQQIDYLTLHTECDGVFGDWKCGTIDNNELIIAYKNKDFLLQLLTEKCIANFSFLMRKEIVDKIGDWDVNINRNQEIDFHLRGLLFNGNFHYQPLLCGLWRMHEGERIFFKTTLYDVISFYQKWEKILSQNKLFRRDVAIKISNLYMWLITQNKNKPVKEIINMLKEVIRLNPLIDFNKSKKLNFLKKLIGIDAALIIWLFQFRRTTKEYQNKFFNRLF
jgi:glycosyltransferase involved in cell wall biosynthesis